MTDALVEAVRSAMTSHLLEHVSPDTVRVALQAIEAAGYRVVAVEATRKSSECFECGCDTSGWLEQHKEGCTQTPL